MITLHTEGFLLEKQMNIYTDFLSREELLFLTGRKQQAKMIEQLNEMGIPFVTNAHGTPIVRRDYAAPKSIRMITEPANEPFPLPNVLKSV